MIVRNIKTSHDGILYPKHGQRFTFGNNKDEYIAVYNADCTICAFKKDTKKCVMFDCVKSQIHFIKHIQKL